MLILWLCCPVLHRSFCHNYIIHAIVNKSDLHILVKYVVKCTGYLKLNETLVVNLGKTMDVLENNISISC